MTTPGGSPYISGYDVDTGKPIWKANVGTDNLFACIPCDIVVSKIQGEWKIKGDVIAYLHYFA